MEFQIINPRIICKLTLTVKSQLQALYLHIIQWQWYFAYVTDGAIACGGMRNVQWAGVPGPLPGAGSREQGA